MRNFSRRAIAVAAVTSVFGPASSLSWAQMPALVKLVVPYAAGGSVDMMARVLAQPLSDQLKTAVVVDNRPGAGGRIAASQVKRDAADGSVILIAPNALTTVQTLTYAGKLDYHILQDFTPVSRLASYPFSLAVAGNSPLKSASELIASLKSRPDARSYGTSGAGGIAHFAGLALGKQNDVDWTQIPYKGGALLVTDVIGGHVPVAIDTLVDQIEYQRSGKIRILGIFSPQRYSLTPDIPTLIEQGVSVTPVVGWFGAFVSSRVPKDTVAQIDAAMARVLQDKDFQVRLNKLVLETSYLNSSEFSKLQAAELQMWEPIIKASGFKPE